MTGCLKMTKRVRVRRTFAAAYVTSATANAQRDPTFFVEHRACSRRADVRQGVQLDLGPKVHCRPPRNILAAGFATGSCERRRESTHPRKDLLEVRFVSSGTHCRHHRWERVAAVGPIKDLIAPPAYFMGPKGN